MMPKNESPVWRYFTKVPVFETGSKYKSGRCIFCQQSYVTNAARMEKHLVDKCTLCPPSVKQIFDRNPTVPSDLTNPEMGVSVSTLGSHRSPVSMVQFIYLFIFLCINIMYVVRVFNFSHRMIRYHSMVLFQSSAESQSVSKLSGWTDSASANIISFVDTMSTATKAQLDTVFARAIYSSALPLSTAESEYWKEFFRLIRPAWSPPSRYQLSNTLLDAEYNNVQSQVMDKIKTADSLTVMSDGWTDVTGSSLINVIVATPEPVFYSAIQSTTQAHTGLYIAHTLGHAIAQIGSDREYMQWSLITQQT